MRPNTRLTSALSIAVIASVVAATTATAEPVPPSIKSKSEVTVQILGINDFHGNLDPPTGSSGRVTTSTGTVDAGGATYLATHIKSLEATNRNTIVVSAGDLIGASPLLSALFHDEPTIEAMNSIGLDLNAVGNHEFDEGTDELLRMQTGGCHPVDGCQDGDPFNGAEFDFLAANVVNRETGQPLFAPYAIKTFEGAKVAFIGMTLEGTPDIVSPSGIAEFDFLDEADTVNALVPQLQAEKVNAIVVLLHEGGTPVAGSDFNSGCPVAGPIVGIMNRLDPEIDMVVSGHTHQPYNCVINEIPVSSAFSFGRLVTDIDMTVSRSTGDVTAISVNNKIVTRTVTPDPAVQAIIGKYTTLSAPLANRVIGTITASITRTANAAGESALGDVIADAQLAATTPADLGAAQIALMNPGGIRADLTYASSPNGEGDGVVTYGEMFTVQPFGNSLVTMTLTGEQIDTVLEQQFGASTRILQVSAGFTYSYSPAAPLGDKVSAIALNGVPLDPLAGYRVTVNSFLADGGDSFPMLRNGTDRLGGAVDTDAMEAYMSANSPVSPGPQNRITLI